MYKVVFSLNEWNFIINFNNEDDYLIYEEVISNSVIDMCHKKSSSNLITIDYLNDTNIYDDIYNHLNPKNKIIISSFMDEYYEKYNDIFVSDGNRYLIMKTSEFNFKIICKENYIRPELIYIIREIYVRLEENKKSIFIHGNGVNIDNKGLIIAGNSGSGKTTFMLKLFEATQNCFSYLSNDRVFLTQDNIIKYFPIPLILANGTARNIKPIYNFLLNRDSLYDSTYSKDILLNGKDDKKYALYKKYIKEIFSNCNVVEHDKLNAIILPKMNFNITDIEVKKTSNYEDLIYVCFTPTDSESLRRPWIQERIFTDEELLLISKSTLKQTLENNCAFIVDYNPNADSKIIREKFKTKILERV